MKVKTKLVAAATAATMTLGPGTATAGIFWPGDLCTTTTTAGGIAALFLVIKKPNAEGEEGAEETTKAAYLYLKQNHLQLAQDLAEGQGPVLEELARSSNIRPENRAHLAMTLQANAAVLLELADPSLLDEARALRFVETYVSIVSADATLSQDLANLRG